MTTPTTTTQQSRQNLNGVDVNALKQTIGAIQQNPPLADFQFRAENRWLGGALNRSTIRNFYGAGKEDQVRTEPYVFECDEPPVLLGQDRAANPVEYLLHALAGCVTTTMVMHAAARGIEVESVESDLEGDIDLQGFLGLSNKVPRGYRKIRVTMRVKSDADADKLKALAQYSPVFNTITNPTEVEVNIVKQ
jgi:uncharacterized OsmC-like protein